MLAHDSPSHGTGSGTIRGEPNGLLRAIASEYVPLSTSCIAIITRMGTTSCQSSKAPPRTVINKFTSSNTPICRRNSNGSHLRTYDSLEMTEFRHFAYARGKLEATSEASHHRLLFCGVSPKKMTRSSQPLTEWTRSAIMVTTSSAAFAGCSRLSSCSCFASAIKLSVIPGLVVHTTHSVQARMAPRGTFLKTRNILNYFLKKT